MGTDSQAMQAAILGDPATSYRLRDALRAAAERDLLDALGDAEALVEVLRERWAEQRQRRSAGRASLGALAAGLALAGSILGAGATLRAWHADDVERQDQRCRAAQDAYWQAQDLGLFDADAAAEACALCPGVPYDCPAEGNR